MKGSKGLLSPARDDIMVGEALRHHINSHEMKNKFYIIDKDENEVSFDYGNIFELEQAENYNRLVIGATTGHVDLIIELADKSIPPYFILYVLVSPRGENLEGRYQSPMLETKEELEAFLTYFKEYFETDGRHNVWVGTVQNKGMIIYDQHNIIYAYGPTEQWKNELLLKGFKEEPVQCPFPHSVYFNDENDKYEDEMMNYWGWRYFELNEMDY